MLGKDNFRYDVSYSDYDLSLPDSDFRAVTLGASKYLYWLSTVSKRRESDPDIWRITGVYYDSAADTVSDQIVIAEFTLPDSPWNGRTYRSVPFEVMLTESGTGYITAKPDTGDEEDHAVTPLTLYSFPISLKPTARLTGASLTETTVCQGEFVTTDLAVMNEGNMGIGSFDVELWLMENGTEARKIETLHADCLYPDNSALIMHTEDGDVTVAKGEQVFYRLKDFDYAPLQHEWIVSRESRKYTQGGGWQKGDETVDRLTTNVLVPGALGGYTGAIRIPPEWEGRYDLRLRLANVSTYTNWMGAVALAQSRPELFAAASSGGVPFETGKAGAALADYGIQKLVYEWDENAGKLVLRQPAEALYAAQIEAPEPVDIDCDVHDIDVGHRLWTDYYGTAMLDIVINNYHTTQEAVELTCAVYLDNARTPRYVSLPYDSSAVSAGKTTTITLPLKTFIPDADQHREARVVISARNVAETATVNNEFTLYLGKAPLIIVQHPRSVTVPVGGTATFTVGVTGGTPPYKYRWQVLLGGKWKDVPGANAATLTLSKVKLKWNGRQTRCVITDAAGATVTSDAATLTVTKLPNTGDPTRLPLYLAVALIAAALLLILRRRARGRT